MPRTAVRRRRHHLQGSLPAERELLDQLGRVAPVAIVAAGAWILAWRDFGSVLAADWLVYALLAALVLVATLLAARVERPTAAVLTTLAALVALAAFDAVSITWSPAPSLARDEALLVCFYAIAFGVAVLTLRTAPDRAFAVGAIAAGAGGIAVAVGFKLRLGAHPQDFFYGGRLDFPVSYVNAQGAATLAGFWPAVATAARRSTAVWIRACALGVATALLAGWLLTQSKGGALGLAVSAAVVFAVADARLRLLVPTALAAAIAAVGSVPLTAPIRADTDAAFEHAIRHGATVMQVLSAAAVLVGAVYGLADRRLQIPPAVERLGTRLALAVLGAGALSVLGLFLASHPIGFVEDKWRSFKAQPQRNTASSHLLSLGSNRYDMWRVAGLEFVHHPLVGTGARGFAAAYLRHRRTGEAPIRAHSLELDTLAETGLVGFALLAAALGLPLALAARRARVELAGAAALGAASYFVVHSAVDWIWTFPAVGVLFFLLLGVGSSSGRRGSVRRSRRTLVAAAVVLAASAVAFVPPWLSARYDSRAAEGGAGAAGDLRWARKLDPLSVDPYVTESQLAPTPAAAIPPLRAAVRKEPRSYALRYLLGSAYLRARRPVPARRELRVALRLNPRDPIVRQALKQAKSG